MHTHPYASLQNNQALLQEQNFKVVVRVRPPLTREMPASNERDENGKRLQFMPITQINKSRSSDGKTACVINIQEYLGQETTEKGRQ